jgi:hypothetical protein
MTGGVGRRLAALGLLFAVSMAGADAHAGGQTTQLALANGGPLVRGSAPLPEFHLDFLLSEPSRLLLAPLGESENFSISLTSPNAGVFQFLFSPRPQLGVGFDKDTGISRSYAGLTWNLFNNNTVFGNLGLAGTYDAANSNDPLHRAVGPPLMVHGALEFGYHLDQQNSLSLSLDHGTAPEMRLGSESSDNLILHYGLKF